ncbi:MAG: molecular chaperone DnaJ [Thermoguttaceae bacterium]|nr:molecular chaperone DnaJ [Thermoguttaceae bacterium]
MAEEVDYYEVLGIERTASEKEISTAYRKAAMKYHPDRNPGDEEAVAKFKLCAEAFEVLNDKEKRSIYDRYGKAGLDGAGVGGGFQDVGDIFGAFGDMFGGFGDMFGSIFGGGGGGARGQRGADVQCAVTLDLREAAKGATKEIRFRRREVCPTCEGSGARPGTKPETCRFCGGRGRVQQSTGVFSIQTVCPKCGGRGTTIAEPCGDCRGSGLKSTEVVREILVPAGVDAGTRLRLQGEGERSPNGGPSGDCYVFVQIKRHPLFRREGQDLICQIPIGYAQAALGAEIEAPTLDGPEKIKIAPGTQNGDVVRLKGRGMPTPRRNAVGDLIVQFYIETPTKLTPEHEAVLRKLAEIEGDAVTPQRKSFCSKLKDFFDDLFADDKDKEKKDGEEKKKEKTEDDEI